MIVRECWLAYMTKTAVSRKKKKQTCGRSYGTGFMLTINGTSQKAEQSLALCRVSQHEEPVALSNKEPNSFSIKYLQHNLKLSDVSSQLSLYLADIYRFLSSATLGFTHLSQQSACVHFPKWSRIWQTWVSFSFFNFFFFQFLSIFETKSQSKMQRLNILCFVNQKSTMTHLSCNLMALLAWKWATATDHLQHHYQGKLMLWLFLKMCNIKEVS